MAGHGLLSKRLAKARIPVCSGCEHGKVTRHPWRTTGSRHKILNNQVTQPGDCISVDQLESTVPGLVAQLKGIPTKTHYRAATIFIDHYSKLSYVHLQKSLTSEEMAQAKQAFEVYAKTHGVIIRHYHVDNGHFQDNAF